MSASALCCTPVLQTITDREVKMLKLLIIIPAYNEAENIVRVVEELKEKVPQYDYVVVNDGSSDNTALICQQHGYHLLNLPCNLGLAGAFQTGINYAYQQGYDAVIQIDGDGQHDPAYIPKMMEMMETGAYDLIIGSRFVTEKRPNTLRMLGNAIIEWAVFVTSGQKMTDPTSGMRIFGKSLIDTIAHGMDYKPEPDTIVFFLRHGAKMKEVQVHMRERVAGESYLSMGRAIGYMIHTCMNIFVLQWVKKK